MGLIVIDRGSPTIYTRQYSAWPYAHGLGVYKYKGPPSAHISPERHFQPTPSKKKNKKNERKKKTTRTITDGRRKSHLTDCYYTFHDRVYVVGISPFE